MLYNIKNMVNFKTIKQSSVTVGLFLIVIFNCGCNQNQQNTRIIDYLEPIDSVLIKGFNDTTIMALNSNPNRYGEFLFRDSNDCFVYRSLNSNNQLHMYNICTNVHDYSERLFDNEINAALLDTHFMYVLTENQFYQMDYQLKIIDSFFFKQPKINLNHGIDFDFENHSNLFKVNEYFVVMYYEIVDKSDGTKIYQNTNPIFYYFNKDTAFFASNSPSLKDSSFQYFRYPAIASDQNHLYHIERMNNHLLKSNQTEVSERTIIDSVQSNYWSMKHEDQYNLSKMKKIRFSTHYNRQVLAGKEHVLVATEYPSKIANVDGIRTYNHDIILRFYDKSLNRLKSYRIRDNAISYIYYSRSLLYIFNFHKQKYYVYKV